VTTGASYSEEAASGTRPRLPARATMSTSGASRVSTLGWFSDPGALDLHSVSGTRGRTHRVSRARLTGRVTRGRHGVQRILCRDRMEEEGVRAGSSARERPRSVRPRAPGAGAPNSSAGDQVPRGTRRILTIGRPGRMKSALERRACSRRCRMNTGAQGFMGGFRLRPVVRRASEQCAARGGSRVTRSSCLHFVPCSPKRRAILPVFYAAVRELAKLDKSNAMRASPSWAAS